MKELITLFNHGRRHGSNPSAVAQRPAWSRVRTGDAAGVWAAPIRSVRHPGIAAENQGRGRVYDVTGELQSLVQFWDAPFWRLQLLTKLVGPEAVVVLQPASTASSGLLRTSTVSSGLRHARLV